MVGYTAKKTRVYSGVMGEVFDGNGELVGRFIQMSKGFHARHVFRHDGAMLPNEQAAIEYLVGIDLVIEARFSQGLEIAA